MTFVRMTSVFRYTFLHLIPTSIKINWSFMNWKRNAIGNHVFLQQTAPNTYLAPPLEVMGRGSANQQQHSSGIILRSHWSVRPCVKSLKRTRIKAQLLAHLVVRVGTSARHVSTSVRRRGFLCC